MPDNIINKIPRVVLHQLTSKAGNPYYRLETSFINGYVFKAFVSDEQVFAIKDAIQTRSSTDDNMLDS